MTAALEVTLDDGIAGGIAHGNAGIAEDECGGGGEVFAMPRAFAVKELGDGGGAGGAVGGMIDAEISCVAEVAVEKGA